jgi:hypothetical protein
MLVKRANTRGVRQADLRSHGVQLFFCHGRGRLFVRVQYADRSRIAGFGLACLAFVWSQQAQAQVKLEYKFTEGDKLTYKTTSKTKQVLTLQGKEVETESDQVVVSSQTVGSRRADSSIPVEEKVESLRAELSLPGGNNVTFDSTNPDAKIDNPALAFLGELFKLAGETRYTIVLDKRNKVQAIEGAEKMVEKAEKLSPPARDAISDRMNTDKLKARFEQEHGNVPDVLCRPGEPWERTEVLDVGGGQTLVFKKRYEYVGTEKKGDKSLEKITSKCTGVEFKQDPAANSPLKLVKGDLKVEESTGTLLFDRENGRVFSATGKTRLKGDMMTFSFQNTELPGALDLTIDSNVELQPVAK